VFIPSVAIPVPGKKKAYRKDGTSSRENLPKSASLHVLEESDITTGGSRQTWFIVGSGAGASILAHQLVGLGRQVLLVRTRRQWKYPSKFKR